MYDCLWNDAIVLLSLCDTRQHPKIVDLIIIKYKIYIYIYSIYSVSTNYISTCYESPGSVALACVIRIIQLIKDI